MNRAVTTLMGFDFGTSRIGIALAQTLTQTARPLTTLPCLGNRPDWQGIADLIETWRPDALVVGIPLCMDDAEQPMTTAARRFARQLEGRFGLPVHEADERLSSREAYDMSRTLGRPSRRGRGRRLPPVVDDLAAQVILQTYLSQLGQVPVVDRS